ncbi:MAG TPA: alpha/beta fold hydrolase [Thermoanaerobaculia bacterium]|nr:alpha/beta fold hydrolase [Thermoanaerobaculia bacterium]
MLACVLPLLMLFSTAATFETRVTQQVGMKYLVHVPTNTRAPLPVLVYLHGGSLRGEDVERLRAMGLPARLEKEPDFPFIVIAPLLPAGEIWTNDGAVIALVDEVLRTQRVDRTRVYITGHSMGGRGALYIAYKHPERFAAVVAMSAVSPIAHWATRLRNVPLWYVHGVNDVQVPVAEGDALVKAIREAGGNVKYTRLDEGDHFLLDFYAEDDFVKWLLAHRKGAQ